MAHIHTYNNVPILCFILCASNLKSSADFRVSYPIRKQRKGAHEEESFTEQTAQLNEEQQQLGTHTIQLHLQLNLF